MMDSDEYLARVKYPLRVERPLYPLMYFYLFFRQLHAQVLRLRQAHAVLPGYCPAQLQHELEHLAHGVLRSRLLIRVLLVRHHVHVDVAVARVPEAYYLQPVIIAYPPEPLQRLGHLAHRHDRVLVYLVRRDGEERLGRAPSEFPERLRLVRVTGSLHRKRGFLKESAYRIRLPRLFGRAPVRLDEQEPARVRRERHAGEFRPGLERLGVHELEAARGERRGHHGRDRPARLARVPEKRRHRDDLLRLRHELQRYLRYDGERALGADQQPREVVPDDTFCRPDAGPDHAAVRQNSAKANNVIA